MLRPYIVVIRDGASGSPGFVTFEATSDDAAVRYAKALGAESENLWACRSVEMHEEQRP